MKIESPIDQDSSRAIAQWIFSDYQDQMLDDSDESDLQSFQERCAATAANNLGYVFLDGDKPSGAVWFELAGYGVAAGHFCFPRHSDIPFAAKVELVRECVEKAFSTGIDKIMWSFFGDNRAFRIFLKKLGASEEGVLRRQMLRRGERVDVVLMASFRSLHETAA